MLPDPPNLRSDNQRLRSVAILRKGERLPSPDLQARFQRPKRKAARKEPSG